MADFNFRWGKPPSPAVLAARARRLGRAHLVTVRTQWFIDNVLNVVQTSLRRRVHIATEYVRSKTVLNISRPVTKTYVKVGGRSGVHITNRSKKGEYPKADTAMLMKTLFTSYETWGPGTYVGYVGTPMDYGIVLELRLDRSFLKRTLYEELGMVYQILAGPIPGAN